MGLNVNNDIAKHEAAAAAHLAQSGRAHKKAADAHAKAANLYRDIANGVKGATWAVANQAAWEAGVFSGKANKAADRRNGLPSVGSNGEYGKLVDHGNFVRWEK